MAPIKHIVENQFSKMKYDITIGNPPYNDDTNKGQREGNLRGGSRRIFNEFAEYSIDRTLEHVILVGPGTNKIYSSKQKREWRKKGLYEVKDVLKYFSTVSALSILTYTFDKTQQRELDDCTYFEVPKNNLGELYNCKPGLPRKEYDHLLKDEGKYKIYVTVNRVKYTDDLKLAKAIYPGDVSIWRVLISHIGGTDKIGKVVIAEPGSYNSFSTVDLPVKNKEEAEMLKEYLESKEVAEISKRTRRSLQNGKQHLSAIPNPLAK